MLHDFLITPLLVAELLSLGLVTGFLAGLLGIGGGMIMVPFLSFILAAKGFPSAIVIKMAVATSLATICFTSLSSVRAHHKRGAVLWPVALTLAPGIILGSLLGAQLAVAIPAKILSILFAVFVAFSATQMFLNKKPKPTRALPNKAGMFGVGGIIGALSSMLGAGGAFVSVPFMTWSNVSIHNAVATSSALGFPIALAGTLGYIWAGWGMPDMPVGAVGYLYMPAVIIISVASVSTAPWGARTAHRIDIAPLKKAFAIFLYVMAASFLFH
ncbi:MAG: sulfite exporter TauE/SafE family protein [Burkholderiaceae bacterium]|nr:sulfite exporter TauE/SafE family protein [Burkholderiaceae bacterium]